MRRIGLSLVLLVPLFLPGCMTLILTEEYFRADDGYRAEHYGHLIYAGTRMNWNLLPPIKHGWPSPIDLPLCLVMDTVILPLTVWETVSMARTIREQEKNEAPQEKDPE